MNPIGHDIYYLVERLMRRGEVQVLFKGNSMYPTLESGDAVVLRRHLREDLRPGVIAAAIYHAGVVLHRIVHVSFVDGKAMVSFCGDNMQAPDLNPVPEFRILGIAVARIRPGELNSVPL